MRIPVIVIDRVGAIDRKIIRTELRRQIISAYEIEDRVIAVTGRIVAVRAIAEKAAIIGMPRCRYLYVDGAEINQAHDEPGQFKELTKDKIHRFEGLDSATARMLWDALRAAKVESGIVENADGARVVLAEYGGKEYELVTEIVEGLLLARGYAFTGAKLGTREDIVGDFRDGEGAAPGGAGARLESARIDSGSVAALGAESPRVQSVEGNGKSSDG